MIGRISTLFSNGLLCLFLMVATSAGALVDSMTLRDYLPDNVSIDSNIPTPSSVLGYEVGQWHVRHDQLVDYFYRLAESSNKVVITEIGRTHEQRPLIHAIISSPENIKRLTDIQSQHINLSNPNFDKNISDDLPAVVWLGYSIHGNEPSGSNASMLLAYYLVAGQTDKIAQLLQRLVIIIDPSQNPDGLGRAANWFNSRKGLILVTDPDHIEHQEAWPNGRTNHYWFDLNRDWLLLQHPESRARIKQFHNWKPNVLTDFHEMGTNSTYFFQPGVPSRQNPMTPEDNFSLTAKFADYHARALDDAGQLYFTEERFDDYYYGKGSTYPDVNGAVGILFEQASSRGHAQDSINGVLKFPDTIKNQFTTSLSTLDAALQNRSDLLKYQADFYQSALKQADRDTIKAYVFGERLDPAKMQHFLSLLNQHQIRVYNAKEDITVEQKQFRANESYIVPLNQPQYRLIKTMFETRTKFKDNTFYDISTWTMPLAYGIGYAALNSSQFQRDSLGDLLIAPSLNPGKIIDSTDDTVAYAIDWQAHYAPRTVYHLLNQGYKVRITTKPFIANTSNGPRSFDYGTVVIPVGLAKGKEASLQRQLNYLAKENGLDIYSINKGLTPQGVDIGSPSLVPLKKPRVLAIGGAGINPSEIGEIWYTLDQTVHLPLTIVTFDQLDEVSLSNYSHVIMVDGVYNSRIFSPIASKLSTWIDQGGTLIAQKRAAQWALTQGLILDTKASQSQPPTTDTKNQPIKRLAYATLDQRAAEQLVSGAIFEADLDITHPLAFGYKRNLIAGFQDRALFLQTTTNPYNTIAQYTKEPLMSGYISPDNLQKISKSAMMIGARKNKGAVILFANNPNFRGFWLGTQKLFINSIFMSPLFDSTNAFQENIEH